MTVTREDIQRALDFITTWKLELSMMGKYNDDVKVEPTIRQVLEDRLNQVVSKGVKFERYEDDKIILKTDDGYLFAITVPVQTNWKAIAEEQNKVLQTARYFEEDNFKDGYGTATPSYKEYWDSINQAISKYEQAIKGE